MYKLTLFSIIAASLAATASATVALYGQCGGSGFTGETVCTAPAVCTYLNYWYSQCLNPSTGVISSSSGSATTKTSTTTTTTSAIITTTVTTQSTTTTPTKTTTTASSASCYTGLPTFSAPAVKAVTPNTTVTGLYLHRRSDGKAVLNKSIAGLALWWTSPGTFALLESGKVNGTSCQYKDFLNVLNDVTYPSASYKPLEFDLDILISTYWSSSKLSVTSASPWGAQSWFLACPTTVTDEFQVYLQTGSDVPSSSCALTQIQ